MRCLLWLALILAACGPAIVPQPDKPTDPTSERWYAQSLDELVSVNRQAQTLVRSGKSDAAAALIMQGEPLSKRLISVPRPTLAATEAASDHDDLYGRMLLSNRNYGWARLFFQKNLVRWKYWKPQTPDTAQRLKQAEAGIADCDHHIKQ